MLKKPPTPPPLARAFSQWLRATREAIPISRYAIVKKSPVSPTGKNLISEANLKALEDNAHDPKLSTFVAVCDALNEKPGKVLTALVKEVRG